MSVAAAASKGQAEQFFPFGSQDRAACCPCRAYYIHAVGEGTTMKAFEELFGLAKQLEAPLKRATLRTSSNR
jgi:hypothetical protein